MPRETTKDILCKILEDPKFNGYFGGIRYRNLDRVYEAIKKIPEFSRTQLLQELEKEIEDVKNRYLGFDIGSRFEVVDEILALLKSKKESLK